MGSYGCSRVYGLLGFRVLGFKGLGGLGFTV